MDAVQQENGELTRRFGESGDICTRFRPCRASELIGASIVRNLLVKAMGMGNTRPKAFLLCGPSGAGKTTSARIAAMGLNCEKGDTSEPCLECPSCKAALSGTAMHILEFNVAMMNKKEDAESMVATMNCRPMSGRNKIYILDECHALTTQAQNLLLKNLEEPPPNTYIFLCTTEPGKLIPTVRKRCEVWNFSAPTKEDITDILNSVYGAEAEVMKDIPSITKEQAEEFKEAVLGRSFREVLKALDAFLRGGLEAITFIDDEDKNMTSIAFTICGWGDMHGKTVDARLQAIVLALFEMGEKNGLIGRQIEGLRTKLLGFFMKMMEYNSRGMDAQKKPKAYNPKTNVEMLTRASYFTSTMYDEQDAQARFLVQCYLCMIDSAFSK